MTFLQEYLRNSNTQDGRLSVNNAADSYSDFLGVPVVPRPQMPLTRGIITGFTIANDPRLLEAKHNEAMSNALGMVARGVHVAAISFDKYAIAQEAIDPSFYSELRETDYDRAMQCILEADEAYKMDNTLATEQQAILGSYPVLRGISEILNERRVDVFNRREVGFTDGASIGLVAIGRYIEG